MLIYRANGFHMPEADVPLMMVGPGTGIAPFRSFWQQREADMEQFPGNDSFCMIFQFNVSGTHLVKVVDINKLHNL